MSREPVFKSNEHFTETFLGKPISNLEIKLLIHYRIINGPEDIDIIEKLGLACHYAKKYFQSPKHVTNKGYILPEHKKNIPLREVTLNIDKQVSEIIAMNKILTGQFKDARVEGTKERPIIKINYDESTHHIKVKNGGLYLE